MAKWYLFIKRLADIAAAVIMLLILAPFFLVVAIIMKLTDPGPIFFSQQRSGLGGKGFTIYKFRTMRIGREHDPFEYVSAEHGDITQLGGLLRRFKFDETPQVWNILKGDMSLIGPRPTLPEQVAEYNDFERRRLEVRPGCTGLAQIHGGITLSWPEKIKWDVYYIDHLGPMVDLGIFFKTFAVILGGDKKFTRKVEQTHNENPSGAD